MYPPSDDETYGRHMADGIKATEAETGNGNDDEAVETDNGDSDVEEAADEPSTTDERSDDGIFVQTMTPRPSSMSKCQTPTRPMTTTMKPVKTPTRPMTTTIKPVKMRKQHQISPSLCELG